LIDNRFLMEDQTVNPFWNVKNIKEYQAFYESGIIENKHFKSVYALVKNLSYSTQYLEFIINSLNSKMHESIKMEMIKSTVIVGIGIIESILYYFIKSNNLQKETLYKEISTVTANDKKIGDDFIRVETKLYKKLEISIEEEMNLDYMLKRAESKRLIGSDSSLYAQLRRLRKLRNKVHLHLIEENLDTDWNNFQSKELIMIKKALDKLFCTKTIFNYDEASRLKIFDFLL
jgi:hypothetical protein